MKRKAVCIVLAALMLLSMCGIGVSAANVFSDVTQKDYPWAINEIEEMASLGIIQGYSGTIFGPADNVTKIQSLLLCSRILGFSKKENAPFIKAASEIYGSALENYEIQYTNEVAYLLYKGVLKTSELSVYISEDNVNEPLKRYEAATLMTKVMGAADEAENSTYSISFKDLSDIPAAAKPYVSYVNNAGIMLGVGSNEFAPMTNVTRAQMATMLYRMMDYMDEEVLFGTASSVNEGMMGIVTIVVSAEDGVEESVSVSSGEDVSVMVDGYTARLDQIAVKSFIAVTTRGEDIYSIEAITIIGDDIVAGAVASVVISGKKGTLKLRDVVTDVVSEYTVAEGAAVTRDGSPGSLSSVKTGDYAEIEIKDGEVIIVRAAQKDRTVIGTVSEITLSPEVKIFVKASTGEEEGYSFAENVSATRNNVKADISSILVGDRVTLTITYNLISKVVASSTSSNVSGTIEEITISTLPAITIKNSNGNTMHYSISRDAEITVDGATATIYDLRLGSAISLSLQGETAVKVSSSAPVSSAILTGVIKMVNSTYGFMLVESVNATTGALYETQVFLKKSGLKIIDSTTGKDIAMSALKADMNVSITGTISVGAFEATTVIVLP